MYLCNPCIINLIASEHAASLTWVQMTRRAAPCARRHFICCTCGRHVRRVPRLRMPPCSWQVQSMRLWKFVNLHPGQAVAHAWSMLTAKNLIIRGAAGSDISHHVWLRLVCFTCSTTKPWGRSAAHLFEQRMT